MKNTSCGHCHENFQISEEDIEFYDKIKVPHPKRCPKCRLMRRLNERNARKLYKRKCDFSGKDIISQYHQDHTFPVYDQEIWWSDKWDAMDFGREYNFEESFFKQFIALRDVVPHFSTFVVGGTMENSDFTNCTGYLKNCYLIFESDYDEDCYYSNVVKQCKDMMDCSICYNDELCYECSDCRDCYNLKYSQDCQNCQDGLFLYDCKSCKDCIGCINLRHKQYHIFNEEYSKEEYDKMKSKFDLETLKGIRELYNQSQNFFKTQPHRHLHQENNQNSFGDHLYNSKNAFYCFDSKDLENCKYCVKLSLNVKSSMDYNSWGGKAELIYDSSACGNDIYNLKFCSTCTSNLSNCEYCLQCTGCSDCFGCIGLKRKKYCILNKQYSKEEYFDLVERIKKHMTDLGEYGEYFPYEACPFGYNESIAMDYYPLSKEEALQKGYKWTEKDATYEPSKYNVPIRIGDVPDSITEELLSCRDCDKNYKIISTELEFYRKMRIPVPDKCPDCRHLDRMTKRNPKAFWDIKCEKCSQEIKTTFSPEDSKIIYCDSCYKAIL
ncbi:hypothetical protein ACFL21_00325 [Patescibacteria group bacterium]